MLKKKKHKRTNAKRNSMIMNDNYANINSIDRGNEMRSKSQLDEIIEKIDIKSSKIEQPKTRLNIVNITKKEK